METLKELTEQGKELGCEGDEFVKKQPGIQREQRLARRLREEKEMELKQIELKVREREKMIIDHEANVQLLETEHKLKLEM